MKESSRRAKVGSAATTDEQCRPEKAGQEEREQIQHEHEARRTEVVRCLNFRIDADAPSSALHIDAHSETSFVVHSQRRKLTRRVSADWSGARR